MSERAVEIVFNPPSSIELQEALTDLWLDVSRAGGGIGFTETVSRDVVAADVAHYFDAISKKHVWFVLAYRDGRLVACGALVSNVLAVQSHFMELKRFMVHPSEQGSGLGAQLVEHAMKFAADPLGLEEVHLRVRGGNGIESFWKRCGFTHVATMPRVVKLSDTDYRDSYYMTRPVIRD